LKSDDCDNDNDNETGNDNNHDTMNLGRLPMDDLGNSLLVSLLVSAVGLAYFIYGKKQGDFLFMADGAALMIYPYFIGGLALLFIVGLVLIAAPFAIRRWM
jgi:hypothetical protein